MESMPITLPMKTVDDASSQGIEFLKYLGCSDDLKCLRSKDVKDIVAAQVKIDHQIDYRKLLETFYPWTPVLDNVQFSEEILYAFQEGHFQQMPMIIGDVASEALLFIYLALHSEVNDAEYVAGIEYIFGVIDGAEVLEYYPPQPFFGDKRPQLSVCGTDYIFICPTRNASVNMANSMEQAADLIYLYNWVQPVSFQFWGPNYTECEGQACHGIELTFLFRSPAFYNESFTPAEDKLSWTMIDYWTNFARTANPNKGLNNVSPIWPAFNSNTMQNMKFIAPIPVVQTNWNQQNCDFFDSIGYHHGW